MIKILEIPKKWSLYLKSEINKEYFKKLFKFLEEEYKKEKIYPPQNLIFNLFENITYEEIKVVILGQDPYHGFGQGNGIAFSVNKGVKLPPSLKNIFKELEKEYSYQENKFIIPKNGDLTKWVKQGVFLLNTTLTVREGNPNSHSKKGWEIFTDEVLKKLNEKEEPIVFLLWGNFAREKKKYITNSRHLVLEAAHPSPLSANRGFFGCNHFIEVNNFLQKKGLKKIDWTLQEEEIQKKIF